MRTRPSARLIVLDPQDRVLLFHFVFEWGVLAGQSYWATPGGALHDSESYAQAARRELLEETGILAEIGAEIGCRQRVFPTPDGEPVRAYERYFLVRAADDTVDRGGQEAREAELMKDHRWWHLSELEGTLETVYPEDIVELVARHLGR